VIQKFSSILMLHQILATEKRVSYLGTTL